MRIMVENISGASGLRPSFSLILKLKSYELWVKCYLLSCCKSRVAIVFNGIVLSCQDQFFPLIIFCPYPISKSFYKLVYECLITQVVATKFV